MALMTGLRHGERLAGIVGLSGYLPLATKTAAERSPANAQVPVDVDARFELRGELGRGAASVVYEVIDRVHQTPRA